MRTRLTILFGVLAGLIGAIAPPASAAWVDKNCSANHTDLTYWKRIEARAYADVGVREGYEWGGGCWNDNDKDDTPNDSDGSWSGAEGPDCSGFTFKSWFLRPAQGDQGGRWYNKFENIHGPYQAWEYANENGPAAFPFHVILDANGHPTKDQSKLVYMDAFAKTSHVAMIYSVYGSSANTDIIIEAVGGSSSPPIGKFERDYAGNSDYVAVRREQWSPDCTPRCATRVAAHSVGDLPTVIVP
jgi:hypothetical protein